MNFLKKRFLNKKHGKNHKKRLLLRRNCHTIATEKHFCNNLSKKSKISYFVLRKAKKALYMYKNGIYFITKVMLIYIHFYLKTFI